MYFVVFATDRGGTLELRERTRPEHRIYLRANLAPPARIMLAGPTFDPSGEKMNGTLLIVEADSIDEVSKLIAGDPYTQAGLFKFVEIRPWHCGLGQINAPDA